MSDIILTDFPKLHCPFIRQTCSISREDYKTLGKKYKLRGPEVYLAVNRINPGYEWVLDDPDTFAVEKLDGSNLKIRMESGRLVAVQNRKNVLDPQQIVRGQTFYLESVINAARQGRVQPDGEQAGECLGPKLQGNPYKLDQHLWYPFEYAMSALRYKSFDEHERSFANWSSWFKDHLHSLFFRGIARKKGLTETMFAEGVIFYNLKRKSENLVWMAKLRRDMFDWYYDGIAIPDYRIEGTDVNEDQDRFD